MQTLKDVFKRQDERRNLLNGGICIAIIILIVLLFFSLQSLNFSPNISTGSSPPPTQTTDRD